MLHLILFHNFIPQIIDVATSLAKVADVDRNLGNEDAAIDGFEEAIKMLQSLELNPEEASLEQRVLLISSSFNPFRVRFEYSQRNDCAVSLLACSGCLSSSS